MLNFLQISTSVKLSKTRATPTLSALILRAHVHVHAKKATRATVSIAEVCFTGTPKKQLIKP